MGYENSYLTNETSRLRSRWQLSVISMSHC